MSVTLSNHCVYDTHYHIVFPIKYRKAVLDEQVSKAVKEIAHRYEIEFENIGTDGDHIHILCSFQAHRSLVTARQLCKRFPALCKELWGGELWSDGYYIATVSKRGDWATVERYVANQGKGKTTPPAQLRLL
ncbi:MAG: IS200/IS605 family transposase [bacterium]|nr:IS200/IS605 family transposase [bacterium]